MVNPVLGLHHVMIQYAIIWHLQKSAISLHGLQSNARIELIHPHLICAITKCHTLVVLVWRVCNRWQRKVQRATHLHQQLH